MEFLYFTTISEKFLETELTSRSYHQGNVETELRCSRSILLTSSIVRGCLWQEWPVRTIYSDSTPCWWALLYSRLLISIDGNDGVGLDTVSYRQLRQQSLPVELSIEVIITVLLSMMGFITSGTPVLQYKQKRSTIAWLQSLSETGCYFRRNKISNKNTLKTFRHCAWVSYHKKPPKKEKTNEK